MSTVSRFEKKEENSGKGFYNIKAVMQSGKNKKLGSILDYAKLGDSERALLDKLVAAGSEGKTITLVVEYNSFDGADDAEDDFA